MIPHLFAYGQTDIATVTSPLASESLEMSAGSQKMDVTLTWHGHSPMM